MADAVLPSVVIDGFVAARCVAPSSVGELCSVLCETAGAGQAIYPVGGRTMLTRGLPPTKPGIAVDMRKLDQVIDYPARDMTITVQAGITIGRLQALLRQEKQRLPVDIPWPGLATLGGAIACNVSGSRRYGFGTLRDYIIGISVVNGQGREFKAGGRVVKNVAGYDLCKLYTGSHGTLGIISQLTLKVRPCPEQSTLLAVRVAFPNLALILDAIHGSATRPVCVDLLSRTAATEIGLGKSVGVAAADGLLLIGYEDNIESVAWQVEEVKKELQGASAQMVGWWSGPAAVPVWETLTDYPLAAISVIRFQANMLPAAVADFCRAAFPLVPRLQAHAGNGIVVGHLPSDTTFEQANATIQQLRTKAVAANGNLILTRCPTEWKSRLGVWGQPRNDAWLMREVKKHLDPGNVFNPGRFVDGI